MRVIRTLGPLARVARVTAYVASFFLPAAVTFAAPAMPIAWPDLVTRVFQDEGVIANRLVFHEVYERLDAGRFGEQDIAGLLDEAMRAFESSDAADREAGERAIGLVVSTMDFRFRELGGDQRRVLRVQGKRLGDFAASIVLSDAPIEDRRVALTWCLGAVPFSVEAAHAVLAAGPVEPIAFGEDRAVRDFDEAQRGSLARLTPKLLFETPVRWAPREPTEPPAAPLRRWARQLPPTESSLRLIAEHLLEPRIETPWSSSRWEVAEPSVALGIALLVYLDGPSAAAFVKLRDAIDFDEPTRDLSDRVLLLAAFPWSDEHERLLTAAIEEERLRRTCWHVLERFGIEAAGFQHVLLSAIRRPNFPVDEYAVEAAIRIGVPREVITATLLEVFEREAFAARDAARRWGKRARERSVPPRLGAWVRRHLDDNDPRFLEALRTLVFETDDALAARYLRFYIEVTGDSERGGAKLLDILEGSPRSEETGRVSVDNRLRWWLESGAIEPEPFAEWLRQQDREMTRAVLRQVFPSPPRSSEVSILWYRRFATALTPHPVPEVNAWLEIDLEQREEFDHRVRVFDAVYVGPHSP